MSDLRQQLQTTLGASYTLSERPAPLIEVKPGVPPPIAALVMQCLEKLPGQRPQRASDVVAALDAIHLPSAAGTMLSPGASRGSPGC
jgi:hypothetical protein